MGVEGRDPPQQLYTYRLNLTINGIGLQHTLYYDVKNCMYAMSLCAVHVDSTHWCLPLKGLDTALLIVKALLLQYALL